MLKKPPRVRDNNGALQVRLRLDGRDFFINRLGRFDDPVAQARAQAICAEIWRDAQQGDLDLSLNRYRPLVEGRDQHLLDALRSLAEEKRQASVVPLRGDLLLLLQEHQEQMQSLGLDVQNGLVFVTTRSHGHLYDSGLEKVWKRSQQRVGLSPRRLYAQRHSFLSHVLALGNSPADLAAFSGHHSLVNLFKSFEFRIEITHDHWRQNLRISSIFFSH